MRVLGKFIMEGMWTRFFPASDKLRDLLFIEKAIGRVTNVFGTFGFKDDGSAPRLTRMDCAGLVFLVFDFIFFFLLKIEN